MKKKTEAKICKNGKKWGTNNSYKKLAYRKLMSDIKFKNGRSLDKDGYIIISVAVKGLPTRRSVREHRYVMEQHLGKLISSEYPIHHINGKKTDNRIENLILCKTVKEHVNYHYGDQS